MAGLIDRLRRAFRPEILARPVAGASTRAARSIIAGHPADGLTPERLASLLRAAEDGDAIAYLELAEQMEERDLHYLGVLGTRKRQVAQLPIAVEAASDSAEHQAHADLIRTFLARDTLEAEIFDMLDALGKGYSITEIIWNTSGQRWLPSQLKWRDPRWFEWDRETGEVLLLKGGYDGTGGIAQRAPLLPYKFILHLHPAKSGLPIRAGLARPVAWSWMFKAYALKDWQAFAEVYGFPFRLGKYDAGASEADIQRLMQAVAGMGVDAAAVIPQSMQIDLIDGKSTGSADLYERLLQYLDRQVSKAVLGQTATTDADTGGLGSGREHGEVRADIERADARLLAATLQAQLVKPIIDLNFGFQASYPSLRIGREEEADIEEMTSALSALVPLGLKVGMSTVRDRLGFPDPAADEVVLAAPASPTPENRPVERDSLPGAPKTPETQPPGFLVASYPSYSGIRAGSAPAFPREALLAAAERAAAAEKDAIDRAVDAVLADDGGQDMLAAIIRPLIAALAAGQSFQEARAILDEAADRVGDQALAAALEAAMIRARMAGEAGQ